MDFTPEQQTAIDAEVAKRISVIQASQETQTAIMNQQHANAMAAQLSSQEANAALQVAQAASSLELQAKQNKLAAIQLAQSTLIANRNNQPVDAREVSAADITAYADTLVNYINI